MSKILITGAGPTSFLGKAVLKEISKFPELDILAPSSKELNLLSEWDVLTYFYKNKINKIVHMAANCGGILKNINHPFDMAYDNLKMATNIFTAIQTYKIEHFIGLATTCAYPVNAPQPMKETDLFNGCEEKSNFFYAESKRMLINLTDSYKKQYGFKAVSLVPANLFGCHDHFSLNHSHCIPALIRKFYEAKLNNDTNVKLWGSGKASREFLFADDCAQAIVKCLINEIDEDLPINIGVGQDILIYDLANLISALIGYNGEILFTGEVSDEPVFVMV